MKIYFAGSIRGGRDDKKLYNTIISHLKKYGEVLTEHVGNPNLTEKGESTNEIQIFKRDVEWINKADVIIAEVTTPSLGVGYEIALSSVLGKKILCLFRPNVDRKLSAMIKGMENVKIENYESPEQAFQIIDEFINNIELR